MEPIHLMPKQALGDFAQAMIRAVEGRADAGEQRRAVGELFSAEYLLHELLKGRSEQYRRALVADDDGAAVRALVFVRGAVQHRGLQAFTRVPVVPFESLGPSEYLTPGMRWAWLPTDVVGDLLPNPETTKPSDVAWQWEMVGLYDRQLADHTLLQTFDVAGDLFRRVAAQAACGRAHAVAVPDGAHRRSPSL